MSHDIFIADDDPDTREILGLVLQTLDISTREASNGQEAVDSIRVDPPALIILDLSMPEMNGQAVLDYLRSMPALAYIPVLVFTAGYVTPELVEQLQVPPERIQRKGTQSMTRLRELIVRMLGKEIGALQRSDY